MLPFYIFALFVIAGLTGSDCDTTCGDDDDFRDENTDDTGSDDQPTDGESSITSLEEFRAKYSDDGQTGETQPDTGGDGADQNTDTGDGGDTGDTNDTTGDGGDTSPEINEIYVSSSNTYDGTDGSDLFRPDLSNDDGGDVDLFDVTLNGGAGNDGFGFIVDENTDDDEVISRVVLNNATISGGDGNDRIEVSASSSTIDGGEGDDDIRVLDAWGTKIYGGDGNDQIAGRAISGDTSYIEGGNGDDVIDARQMENVTISGGSGADTILLSRFNDSGAGYATAVNADEGQDTLIYLGGPDFNEMTSPITMLGGADADTFQVVTNEGGNTSDTFEENSDINYADDTYNMELVRIGDFDPSTESIIVRPEVNNTDYSYDSITLEEDTDAGTTSVIVHYLHSGDEADRNVIIVVEATGLTDDNVQLAVEQDT